MASLLLFDPQPCHLRPGEPQLAHLLDTARVVSYSYYHKIEAHKRTPGLKLAHKIFEKCRGDDDEPLVPMQRWCERYEFRKKTPVPPDPENYPSEPLIVRVGDRRMLRIRDGWMPLDD